MPGQGKHGPRPAARTWSPPHDHGRLSSPQCDAMRQANRSRPPGLRPLSTPASRSLARVKRVLRRGVWAGGWFFLPALRRGQRPTEASRTRKRWARSRRASAPAASASPPRRRSDASEPPRPGSRTVPAGRTTSTGPRAPRREPVGRTVWAEYAVERPARPPGRVRGRRAAATARAARPGSHSSAGARIGLRTREFIEVEGEGAAVGQRDGELARAVLVGVRRGATGGVRLGVRDDFLNYDGQFRATKLFGPAGTGIPLRLLQSASRAGGGCRPPDGRGNPLRNPCVGTSRTESPPHLDLSTGTHVRAGPPGSPW